MGEALLKGSCRALYCVDIARGIDLTRAEASLSSSHRRAFHHKRRVPEGTGICAPLRLAWESTAQEVAAHVTTTSAEVAIYDLGALCITWEIPFDCSIDELVKLSAALYDNTGLIARSRGLAEKVMAALGSALDRPGLSAHVEDYMIFQSGRVHGGPQSLLREFRQPLARILRAEVRELSTQETDDALAHPVSYGRDDVCLVDWLAAFLVGPDTEDERLALELATVELLELDLLDSHLETQIGQAYELLAQRRGLWSALTQQRRELVQVGRIQADVALLHEGIDNALKFFGDDYLARLHRTSAERFHFEDWGRAIQRKLGVLQTVYQSLADLAAHRRSEALEWIIILLIAFDIVLYFTPLR